MGRASRQKGARGELEWRSFLRGEGWTARRGQQYAGSADSPDVICDELRGRVHMEVKRVERLNLLDAMSQARGDAGDGEMPVVCHRRNHSEWLVTLTARDWCTLLRSWL